MGRLIIYSGTEWNTIDSTSTSYTAARAGTGTKTLSSTAPTYSAVGQAQVGTAYHAYELLLHFDTTAQSADNLITSANIRLTTAGEVAGVSPAWNLEVRKHNWGTIVEALDDYVPGSDLSGLTLLGTVVGMDAPAASRWLRAGDPDLIAELETWPDLRVLLASSRLRLANESGQHEYRNLYGTNATTTARRPALEIFTVRKSTLNQVGGALAQLKDGTHVYLQSNALTSPTITLRHRDKSNNVTTVATLSTGLGQGSFRPINAWQALALVVDEQDNVYVIGRDGANSQALAAKCFRKGTGYTWTPKSSLTAPLVGYTGAGINNVAAAYHLTVDGPRIGVVVSHAAGQGDANAFGFATLDANALRLGEGDALVQAVADPTWLSFRQGALNAVNYPNETGSNLDIGVDGTKGYVFTLYGGDQVTSGKLEIGKYDMDGPEAAQAGFVIGGTEVTQPKNGDSKIRSIAIPGRGAVFLAMGRLLFRSTGGTTLASLSLYSAPPAGFPTEANFPTSNVWDAIYDPANDKVWIYYLASTDSRILRRVGVSLTSYTIDPTPVTVTSALGDSGSTNLAIRAPRGLVDERQVLIQAANLDGTTYSTVSVVDSFNVSPNAPVLGARPDFDARVDTTFSWTFKDPNPRDTQSAYQLKIIDTADSSVDLDTGKVASSATSYILPDNTLTNGKSYQWQVQTWDAADAPSTISALSAFSTLQQGTVEITDPALDNVSGIAASEYDLVWTFAAVSGATQASRRVRVVRTFDEAQLFDTGFETTSSTTYQVTNLESDVEVRVEVTVVDSDGLTSNTATRLITPSYATPEIPIVTVTAGEMWVDVEVSNPEATGSKPPALYNLIYRRPAGGVKDHQAAETGRWINVGRIDPNESFRDYEAAADIDYEYAVMAVA